jgi:hypothetical protein
MLASFKLLKRIPKTLLFQRFIGNNKNSKLFQSNAMSYGNKSIPVSESFSKMIMLGLGSLFSCLVAGRLMWEQEVENIKLKKVEYENLISEVFDKQFDKFNLHLNRLFAKFDCEFCIFEALIQIK